MHVDQIRKPAIRGRYLIGGRARSSALIVEKKNSRSRRADNDDASRRNVVTRSVDRSASVRPTARRAYRVYRNFFHYSLPILRRPVPVNKEPCFAISRPAERYGPSVIRSRMIPLAPRRKCSSVRQSRCNAADFSRRPRHQDPVGATSG